MAATVGPFTIAVVAAGEMGSGVGWQLHEKGARVVTNLAGRSAASRERAAIAGFVDLGDDATMVAEADYILSIVPPSTAVDFARRLAPHLGSATRKPVFVDCNAIAPRTARAIAEVLAPTGVPYVDAGIVGGAPGPGRKGPVFYASGEPAGRFARLGDFGLIIRVLDGGIGVASAMKLSYAGLTKGTTAIMAAMVLGSVRAGTQGELVRQLAESQPAMLDQIVRGVPGMIPKAYRWDGEMEEIAAFLEEDEAASAIYLAVARLYRRIAAADAAGPDGEIAAMTRFCEAARAFLAARPRAAE